MFLQHLLPKKAISLRVRDLRIYENMKILRTYNLDAYAPLHIKTSVEKKFFVGNWKAMMQNHLNQLSGHTKPKYFWFKKQGGQVQFFTKDEQSGNII
jgi:hypothetical protein